jgi:hypothetical protein
MPSSQKLQIWLKPNCTWMFIRWSSTNFTFFVPIWNSKWRLRSCDGGHLGFPIGIKNRNLVKDIPMIIHLQFGFSQFISFRKEDLWNFSQSEHIIDQASSPKPHGRLEPNLAGMFLGWSSTKWLFFVPVGYSIWLPGSII